jgi:hypothetical protein
MCVVGLYGLLEATERLGKPKLNHVFTTTCRNTPESSCHSYSRYLDLPLALNVRPDTYGCIADYPHTNVCFKFAGFGFKNADKKQFYRCGIHSCFKSIVFFLPIWARVKCKHILLYQVPNSS